MSDPEGCPRSPNLRIKNIKTLHRHPSPYISISLLSVLHINFYNFLSPILRFPFYSRSLTLSFFFANFLLHLSSCFSPPW
ncbi:hypothetical protein Csa_008213 [Cucumis sativus]|uniref:Uncharacterized protein n=1 Tax=Cucumis sativus TaxID=3659 RepID=A0A0A0KS52_CUCSA|nr:hypothetical protein Csa_008213 [Cucumis sativus]